MKARFAIASAAMLLAFSSSGASAAYCRAYGVQGGSGWGRSESFERARYLALYQCSKRGWGCRISECVR